DEPGAGREKSRAIKPPTIDPPMPRSVVMMKLRCWTPGIIARAIKPTIKPTMMDQMMCNMGLSWLGREGYHGANLESESFSAQDRQGGSAAPPGDVSRGAERRIIV